MGDGINLKASPSRESILPGRIGRISFYNTTVMVIFRRGFNAVARQYCKGMEGISPGWVSCRMVHKGKLKKFRFYLGVHTVIKHNQFIETFSTYMDLETG
jgi:hypothetical protein